VCLYCIEKISDELRKLLSKLVYWHDQDNGHIDESWWDEARSLLGDATVANTTGTP